MAAKSSQFLIEPLEPRVLLDGALLRTIEDAVASGSEPIKEDAKQDPQALDVNALSGKEIAFVDYRVADRDALMDSFGDNIEVFVLGPHQSGVQQMADFLRNRRDVTAVHLFAHGEDGRMDLGSTSVDTASLAEDASLWGKIGSALTQDADFLIYACDLSASETGQSFVAQVASLTGADVAASDDTTGVSGDWELETQTGEIEARSIAARDYQYDLNNRAPSILVPGLVSGVESDFATGLSVDAQTSNLMDRVNDPDTTDKVFTIASVNGETDLSKIQKVFVSFIDKDDVQQNIQLDLIVKADGSYSLKASTQDDVNKLHTIPQNNKAEGTFSYTVSDPKGAISEAALGKIEISSSNNNSNTAPTLTVKSGDSAASSLSETNTGLTTSGTLTLADVDTSDTVSSSVQSVSANAGLPSGIDNATVLSWLSVSGSLDNTETTDSLSWSFNSGAQAFDALDAGDSLVLTYVVRATDSNNATADQNIVVTITGTADSAVVAGSFSSSVTEDGTSTATGSLSISDVDGDDSPSFADDSQTGTYGSIALVNGTWTYTLDNSAANVQALDAGEQVTDSFTFTASDNTTQVVTVTVNGANDTPTIANAIVDQSGTEDSAFSFTVPTNTFNDVDADDSLSYSATLADGSALPSWLSFDASTRTFSGTPENADVGSVTVRVTATDGSSATVSDDFVLAVANTNDVPTVTIESGDSAVSSLSETNTGLTTSGTLTLADVDTSDTVSSSVQSVSANAELPSGIDNATVLSWLSVSGSLDNTETTDSLSWSFNSGAQAFDALDAGDSLVLTYVVRATDSNNATADQNIVITITGSNDSFRLSAITETVNRDEAQRAINLVSLASITDPDVNDTHAVTGVPSFTATLDGQGINLPANAVVVVGNELRILPRLLSMLNEQDLQIVATYDVTDGVATVTNTATIDVVYSRPAFYDRVSMRSISNDGGTEVIKGQVGAMDRAGQIINFDNVNKWLDKDGQALRFGFEFNQNNTHLSFAPGSVPAAQTVMFTNTSGAQLKIDTATGMYEYIAGNSPDSVEEFKVWVSDGTNSDFLYLVFDQDDKGDRDGISEIAENTLKTLAGFNAISDTIQHAVTTLAWVDRATFNQAINLTANTAANDQPQASSIVQIRALDSSGNINNMVQISDLEVLELREQNDISAEHHIMNVTAIGDRPVTSAWDPLRFNLESIRSLGFEDVDSQTSGVQTSTYIDLSSSNLAADAFNSYVKFVSSDVITAYANEGIALNDLNGEAITTEGWYDFTAKLDSNGERTTDGAVFVYSNDGENLIGIELRFTDNQFGDNNLEANRIEDPGTLANVQEVFAYSNENSGNEDTTAALTGNVITEMNRDGKTDRNDGAGSLTVDGIRKGELEDGGVILPVSAQTSVVGTYGTLTIKPDGSYSYSVNNDGNQILDAGDTVVDQFVYSITNGNQQDEAELTIAIDGRNDAPTISDIAVTTNVNAVSFTQSLVAGADDVDDDHSSQDIVLSGSPSVSAVDQDGASVVIPNNAYSISGNDITINPSAFDPMVRGNSVIMTVSYFVSDGTDTTPNDAVFTINATNNAPSLTVTDLAVNEDGNAVSATALATDPDNDGITFTTTQPNRGSVSINASSGEYTFTPGDAFQTLDAGDTATVTFDITASDGVGGSVTETVNVTFTGTNDTPTIANAIVDQSGTEDSAFSFTVPANTFNDVDADDSLSYSATLADGSALPSWLSFDASTRTFSGTPENADVGSVTVRVTATDGSSATVSDDFVLAVANTNDVPTVTIESGDSAASSLSETNTGLTASGTLTLADVDTSDTVSSSVQSVSANAELPSGIDNATVLSWLSVSGSLDNTETTDSLSWSFNSGAQAFDTLDAGDSLVLTYVVRATDSNNATADQNIVITITGTADSAVVSGSFTSSVTEDGTSTATGTLSISDVDGDDSPSFADDSQSGTYGSIALVGGTWTYTLDNSAANVQALDAGEQVTDSFTFTASDNTTQVVTVTVNGANDTPTIANAIVDQSGTEDSAFSFVVPANSFADVDADDSLSYSATLADGSALPSWLSFDASTRTFSGTPENADVGSVTVRVTATDGSSATVSDDFVLAVANTNDVPTVTIESGDSAASSLSETNTGLTASGTLTLADVDTSDTVSSSVQSVSANAELPSGIDNATVLSWLNVTGDLDNTETTDSLSWSFNSGAQAFDALDAGDSLVLTYVVRATDSNNATTDQNIVITITGTADSAVVSGSFSSSVTEDGTSTATGTLSISDVDGDDSPSFANDSQTGTYGSIALVGGTWTYTLDNSAANVQALDAGEQVTDSFTFTASDNTTQVVTVTVNGANDTPTIANAIVDQSGTEDSAFSFVVPANSFADVDADDSLSYSATLADGSALPSWLSFDASTRTFSGTPENADVGSVTVRVTATDGSSATVSDDFELAVANTNDVPTVTIESGDSAASSLSETNTGLTASGTLTLADVDASDTVSSSVQSVSANAELPSGIDNATVLSWLSVTGDLDNTETTDSLIWSFNSGAQAFDTLDAGDSLVLTYVVRATDSNNATADQNIVITITGTADSAVVAGSFSSSVTEDGTSTATGTLSISDVDGDDSPSFADDTQTGTYGSIALVNGTWTYTLDNTAANVQALDAGEQVTDSFTFTASDNTTQVVTVTINGSDDSAVVSGSFSSSVTEDGTSTATGTLSISDVDGDDSPSFADDSQTGTYGSIALVNGTWTYTLDNTASNVQALDAGEQVTDSFTFTASDNTTQVVTVTINGSDDSAVVAGSFSSSVTEDGTSTATGSLSISDVDGDDSPSFADDSQTGTYGSIALVNGTWTYTLDNSAANVQALDAGEQVTDSFTFTASDNTTQVVTVTINGSDDSAVVAGSFSSSVTEDGTSIATGSLSISDVDGDDSPSFADDSQTGTYGSIALVGGTWTYTLDNTAANVQALDAGDQVTDSFTFTASDSTTQVVTVTINGSDDSAVVSGSFSSSVTEDGTSTATGSLSISDVDGDDSPSFADDTQTGTYGSIALVNGTWTYTLDNSAANVQALDAGEQVTDSFTFTASDNTTQVVTVTINGADDSAVVSGSFSSSVTEDGTSTATGSLSISDVDGDDSPSFADDSQTGTYGSIALVNGTWTYTLDNSASNVQALDAGEQVTDSFTFTASDNTTQVVTVTINGSDDSAVVSGSFSSSVTEDGTSTATGSLSISDVDGNDSPSFADDTQTGTYGSIALVNGTWTYTLDNTAANVQALDAGDQVTDSFTFTASDSTTQVVTVTINGSDDSAVVSGSFSSSVTEDGTSTATGSLSISDVDGDDSPSFADDTQTGTYGSIALVGGTWTYTLDNTAVNVQALDAGEQVTDSFTFTASDNTTQVVTVTVNGANDTPTIANAIVDQSGTEDSAFSFTVPTNTFNDVDADDSLSYSATLADGSALPSWLSFDASTRTFSGTPENADVGSVTVRVTATDGSSATVSDDFVLAVANTNDAPTINQLTATKTYDDASFTQDLLASAADIDDGATISLSGVVSGSVVDEDGTTITLPVGAFSVTGNTVSIDPSVFGSLAVDEQRVLTLSYDITDGIATTANTMVVTITGANQAPVLSVSDLSVVEDGAAVSGTVTASDAEGQAMTYSTTQPSFGSVTIDASTGEYTFTPGSSFQDLDAGDITTVSFDVTATDSLGGTATDTVVVTITGTNDTPTIANAIVDQSGTEDSAFSFVVPANSFADVDADDSLSYSATLADGSALPSWLSFDASTRTFSGTPENADVGSVTVRVTATDGSSATVSDDFVLAVANTNDVPTVTIESGDSAASSLSETNTGLTASGTLTLADVDTSDTVSTSVQSVSANAELPSGIDNATVLSWLNVTGDLDNTETTDSLSWSFNSGAQAFDALDAGDSLVLTYVVRATDSNNATTDQNIVITITGTADSAVVSGSFSSSVTEDGTSTATGTLSISDVDGDDSPSFANDSQTGTYGSIALVNGTWTYTLDNTASNVQALDAGEQVTDSFTFTASDNTTQVVTVTINGSDDSAMVSGSFSSSVTEDGTSTATGSLSISDVDGDDSPSFADDSQTGTYGSIALVNGTWTYTLDNTAANVQALDAGEQVTDSFTFTASDNTTQVVTVTITGTADSAVVAGSFSSSVTEDGTSTATGTLSISDVDGDDSPSFADDSQTGTYGSIALVNGTWTYTLDNTASNVQALDAGEQVTDSFTFTASDNTTQVVTVTVNGANDTPTIANAIVDQSGTEDSAFTFVVPANSFADVDADDSLSYSATLADGSALPSWLSFDASTRTFSGTPENADVGSVTVRVTATDGSSATVSDDFVLAVANTNDAPTINVQTFDKVDSDEAFEVDLLLGAVDVDNDTLAVSDITSVIVQDQEDNSLALPVNMYSLDGQFLTIDPSVFGGLGQNTIRYVTFDYNISDGHTEVTNQVVINISGTNTAPSLAVVDVNVQEDGGVVTGQAIASDDDAVSFSISQPVMGAVSINTQTGEFIYNPLDQFQSLAVDETATETFTITVTDSFGVSVSQDVTVTVVGTNDSPIFFIIDGQEPVHNIEETDEMLSISGSVLLQDVDITDILSVSVSGVTATGDTNNQSASTILNWLTVRGEIDSSTNNVEVSYEFNAPSLDYLTEGTILELEYIVDAIDASGEVASQAIQLLITGSNDHPTISAQSYTLNNTDAPITVDLIEGASDIDNEDTLALSESIIISMIDESGNALNVPEELIINDGNTITFSPESLGEFSTSESRTVTYSYQITDDNGAVINNSVTFIVNGSNMPPVLTVSNLVAVEDGDAVTASAIAVDRDAGDTLTYSVTQPEFGQVSIDPQTGVYTFDPLNAFQYLAQGQEVEVSFIVSVTDRSGEVTRSDVLVTVIGQNDRPAMSIRTELLNSNELGITETNLPLTGSGTLTLTDIDVTDLVAVQVIGVTVEGDTNQIQYNDILSWLTVSNSLDNTQSENQIDWRFAGPAFDYLNEGEQLVLTYSLVAEDTESRSTDLSLTITITGTMDMVVMDDSESSTETESQSVDSIVSNEQEQESNQPGISDGTSVLSSQSTDTQTIIPQERSVTISQSIVSVSVLSQADLNSVANNDIESVTSVTVTEITLAQSEVILTLKDFTPGRLYTGEMADGNPLPDGIKVDPVTGQITLEENFLDKDITLNIYARNVNGDIELLQVNVDDIYREGQELIKNDLETENPLFDVRQIESELESEQELEQTQEQQGEPSALNLSEELKKEHRDVYKYGETIANLIKLLSGSKNS